MLQESVHSHQGQSGHLLPSFSKGIIKYISKINEKINTIGNEYFYQSLRLSQKALGETTIGQMINIISNDVGRFDLLFPYLHYLWVGPLAMIITTALLYYVIGLASLVGLVVLFILVPVQRNIFLFLVICQSPNIDSFSSRNRKIIYKAATRSK